MMNTTLVRRIAARPAIVFDALVTAEGIGSWWGPDDFPVLSAAADPRVGGSFRVRFRTADGLVHECSGEFLEIKRPECVIMSWRWVVNGVVEEHDKVSRIEFHLHPIDTGTELTFVHAGLSNEVSALSHQGGWAGAFEKLMRRFSETQGPRP